MMLRGKLLLALLPLALALVLVGVLSVRTTHELGSGAQAILQDNYRSVLAAQRMKDAVSRIDAAATALVLNEARPGPDPSRDERQQLERELQVQEHNITEPGERAATQRLRAAWDRCEQDFAHLAATADPALVDRVLLTPQVFDLAALASAYGWEYRRVVTRGELEPALTPTAGQVLIEVPLSRS